MDYKVFSKGLELLKKQLIDFINNKIKKDIDKIDDTVAKYIANMEKGQYSIKSYKAKIIHNALDHRHNHLELDKILPQFEDSSLKLFNDFFTSYLETLKNINASLTKDHDLKDFRNSSKKEKQELIGKKNTIEKELTVKKKEYESTKQTKVDEFNNKIQEIRVKLNNNLNKISEKTIRSYSEIENTLLNCNDKNSIAECNKKITEFRLKGLAEEYNYKVQIYNILYEEEVAFLKEIETYTIEVNSYIKGEEIKILECNNKIAVNGILSDYNELEYDENYIKNNFLKFNEDITRFMAGIKNHNEVMKKVSVNNTSESYTYEDNIFLIDIVLLNLYHIVVQLRKNNLFDPLILGINYLISMITNYKDHNREIGDFLLNDSNTKKSKLLEVSDKYEPLPKKASKEELQENIVTTLDRFYVNFFKEIDYYNKVVFKELMFVVNEIINEHDKLDVPQIGHISSDILVYNTKYNYIDLKELGYYYKNLDEQESEEETITFEKYYDTINDNCIKMKDEFLSYCNNEITRVNNSLLNIEKDKNNSIKEVNSKTSENVNNIEKEMKEFESNCRTETITNEKRIKKSTRKYISNAKRLYNKSIKVL